MCTVPLINLKNSLNAQRIAFLQCNECNVLIFLQKWPFEELPFFVRYFRSCTYSCTFVYERIIIFWYFSKNVCQQNLYLKMSKLFWKWNRVGLPSNKVQLFLPHHFLTLFEWKKASSGRVYLAKCFLTTSERRDMLWKCHCQK